MLENQLIPTSRIGLSTIAESPIDWDIVYPGSEISFNLTLRETYEPRPHQVTAIDKTLAGFQIHDRGKLIMACGTGKTFTALRLAEQFAEKKRWEGPDFVSGSVYFSVVPNFERVDSAGSHGYAQLCCVFR